MGRRRTQVLILGGTGMLGSMVWKRLSPRTGLEVRRSQRRDKTGEGYFDALGEAADLDRLLSGRTGTDFVVNALGLTRPEIREGEPATEAAAWAVNADLPKRLARAAARHGIRVIHVSTDAVFSGRDGPYDEGAVPDPQDLYGRTKLEGEVADRSVLTLRCSIVGPDPDRGRGLFEWFRRRGAGGSVDGYVDQLWNGVTTVQFADLCRAVIERQAFDRLTAVAPVRHFCPNAPVTKSELLQAFASALGSSLEVRPVVSGRPVNRVLRSRWRDLDELLEGPRDLREAVAAMLSAGGRAPGAPY